MASLNQFQFYSQAENTITNNVLLMMSRLYDIRPQFYETFLNSLVDSSWEYTSTPNFQQQVGDLGKGVVDGHIHIPATSIIIEAKKSGKERTDKLLKYVDNFPSHGKNLLIHLSNERYSEQEIEKIRKNVLDKRKSGVVWFESITYEDLNDSLAGISASAPWENQLTKLQEDFDQYCQSHGLLFSRDYMLRAMACGQSYRLNEKHKFYFDLARRGYSSFGYLGIYFQKAVRFIGKVEVNVEADLTDDGELIVKNGVALTSRQKERLVSAIKETEDAGWWIRKDHRFFLFDEDDFYETMYRKSTSGGIFRVKYINLKEVIKPWPDSTRELSEKLKTKSWE